MCLLRHVFGHFTMAYWEASAPLGSLANGYFISGYGDPNPNGPVLSDVDFWRGGVRCLHPLGIFPLSIPPSKKLARGILSHF